MKINDISVYYFQPHYIGQSKSQILTAVSKDILVLSLKYWIERGMEKNRVVSLVMVRTLGHSVNNSQKKYQNFFHLLSHIVISDTSVDAFPNL